MDQLQQVFNSPHLEAQEVRQNGGHGNGHRNGRRLHRQTGPQFRDGIRLAVKHAFYAAGQVLEQGASVVDAATNCGSSQAYTAAMVALRKHGDGRLIDQTLWGEINLLAAARKVKARRVDAALEAYEAMDADETVEFLAVIARKVGVEGVWDIMINPLIGGPHSHAAAK